MEYKSRYREVKTIQYVLEIPILDLISLCGTAKYVLFTDDRDYSQSIILMYDVQNKTLYDTGKLDMRYNTFRNFRCCPQCYTKISSDRTITFVISDVSSNISEAVFTIYNPSPEISIIYHRDPRRCDASKCRFFSLSQESIDAIDNNFEYLDSLHVFVPKDINLPLKIITEDGKSDEDYDYEE